MPFASDPFATLRQAGHHVRQFRGKTFVVKVGGELLERPETLTSISEQLALLWSFSIPIVIVHGGGSSVDAWCKAIGLPVVKVGGRRVTSPEVLRAARMAIKGDVQMRLLSSLLAAGLPAVGISGQDAGLVTASKRPPVVLDGVVVDFGQVGDITGVSPALVNHLIAGGFVPVIAPFTAESAGPVYNTNADTVAAALSVALRAEKLLFLTTVPGLLKDAADLASLIPFADLAAIDALGASGAIHGGMRPKLQAARYALSGGVPSVHVVSGLSTDNLLVEIFTNEGSGTMLVRDAATQRAMPDGVCDVFSAPATRDEEAS
jgi:acetylglutamate kinase